MQCLSYCTGSAYNLMTISEYFSTLNISYKAYGKDLLRVKAEDIDINNGEAEIFIFSYGCVVFWGLEAHYAEKMLLKIRDFLNDAIEIPIVDKCNYALSEEQESCVDEENDTIMLNSRDPYLKISFSYGLSQSVKLIMFENAAAKTIEENKSIPSELIKTGKISMSRKKLAKKIGTLFAERNFINLNSDILDTPDFFWRRPKYEPYYEMSVDFMDIKQRLNILNSRLSIIHELYEILSTELNHIHYTRLETIVMYLISIGIVLSIVRDFF